MLTIQDSRNRHKTVLIAAKRTLAGRVPNTIAIDTEESGLEGDGHNSTDPSSGYSLE